MTSPVTFTWDKIAKSAVIVIVSKEEKRHQMTKGSETKFTYITTLLPGKYYYYYIIDNKRVIDFSKPIEQLNNEAFNTITIHIEKESTIIQGNKAKDKDDDSSIDNVIEIDNQFSQLDINPELKTHLDIDGNNSLNNTNSKIINNNTYTITNVSNARKDMTNQDISNTFSIKKENMIQKIECSDMIDLKSFNINAQSQKQAQLKANANANTNISNKVIVYNYEDQYLIPMEIIQSDEKDSSLIKLRHIAKKKEYMMSINDIFYQLVDQCIINDNPYGNLIEMKEVNELSILKNIQIKLRNNITYMYINDSIFFCFYFGLVQTDRDFFLSEYIRKNKQNQTVIVRSFSFNNSVEPKENNALFILRKYLEVNCSFHHMKYYTILSQFIQIIAIRMKYMIRISFNTDTSVIVNFIPQMSSYLSSSDLYLQTIFFTKESLNLSTKKQIKHKSNDASLTKDFSSLVFKNNPGSKELSILFNNIYETLINTQCNTLESIKNLLNDLNCQSKFQNVIKLIIISYIALNYHSIFNNDNSNNNKLFSSINIGMINEKNMIYYSNIVILLMIKYINHLIEGVFNKGNRAREVIQNNVLLCYNRTDFDEDDILLNEAIKKRSMPNNLTDLNKRSISYYYKYFFQENISNFDLSLSPYDLKLISLIENIYELDFLSISINQSNLTLTMIHYKKSILINYFNYSCQSTLNSFEESEINYGSIKQVWRFDLGESFESFVANQEKVSHFFQITQILEYIQSIQSLLHNNDNCNSTSFRSYTTKEFFNYFLPILRDIDVKYNINKDYSMELNQFIKDIQSHLSISEHFSVTSNSININYNTFEILMFLLKNVYEDHIQILQAKYKRCIIFKLISQLRKSTLKLQYAWRRVLYGKYTKMSQRECLDRIISRYKSNDPMLLMYIIKTQKEISLLESDKVINNNLNTLSSRLSFLKGKEESFVPNKSITAKYNPTMNRNIKRGCDQKKNITCNQYLTQSSLSISNKNSGMNTSITRSEINSLKEKLTESREQYKELVNVLVEYEKKLENFIGLINSNQEVKDVLNKNGIQIN